MRDTLCDQEASWNIFLKKFLAASCWFCLCKKKKKGNRFGKQHRRLRYLCHTYKQMPVQTKHVRKGLYEQARPLNALPSWNTSSPLLHICAWRCWPLKFQGTSNGSVPDLANVANLFWICLVINYAHWTGRHVVLLSFFPLVKKYRHRSKIEVKTEWEFEGTTSMLKLKTVERTVPQDSCKRSLPGNRSV